MKIFLTLAALVSFCAGYSQTDFDNYTPLKSSGTVPFDFATPTSEKIQKAQTDYLKDLTGKERELFIEEVNYSIDELLKSGQVTFGDPVSLYLQGLGDLLTENDPKLKGKLRFYTYNTNEANAFSTDQGMVFVTTGLIAQLTNEAQLAFVLAHEIIHYREKHVVDLFDYSTDNSKKFSYSEKVRLFSKYSRDNEFEADSLAVALVHSAGFAPSEINVTFDVLLYSYLPFEELVFDKTYFNNEWMFVPNQAFEIQKKEISARSNYNDRLNSHPNVAKRKEELTKKIATFDNWGTTLNRDEKQFNEIRNICRFEFVLNFIYDEATTDALYGIYILEKQFPDSRFLRNCKSQVWLDLMRYEKRKGIFDYSYDYYFDGEYDGYSYNYYEGNIAKLDHFLQKLPKEGKLAMGLRVIRDNYLKDTADKFAYSLWDKAVKFTAYNDIFEDVQFSKYTFDQAIARMEKEKHTNDSLKAVESNTSYSWNKYETIKNQKQGIDVQNGIDSTKFYLYGVSDMVNDSLFNQRVAQYTEQMKDENDKEDGLYELTDDELSDYYTEESDGKLHLGIDSVLLINPLVYEIKGYQSLDYRKSDELEKTFIKAVTDVAADQNVNIKQLDRSDQHSLSSDDYNNLAQLMRSLNKRVDESKINSFMLDEEMLDSLRKEYGTSHVILFELEHDYNPQIYAGPAILWTIVFPVGLVYFPAKLLSGHTSELRCYVLDLNKGELVLKESFTANDPASEKFLKLRLNALFHQLKQEKE